LKLAVYYHTCLTFNRDHGLNILGEQLKVLRNSQLLKEADQFLVGVNGTEEDEFVIAWRCPSG
jgi:hypothetical protein